MPKHRILIIDYEPRGIKQLADPLSEAGYRVEIATDGIRGIESFNSIKPDLTLIEAMLPKRHGFEVCQELKKTPHGLRTPIVIVTSVYKGRKYRSQALHHHGCDEYMEKPIPADKLLETVSRLLEGREPHAPEPVATRLDDIETPVEADDSAEREIMDRLDAILPGDGGKGPPSGPTSQVDAFDGGHVVADADDENVVSFDPDRARKRRGERSQAASTAPPVVNGTSPASATAEALPTHPIVPAPPVATPAANTAPETERAAQPAVVVSVDTPKTVRGGSVWILVGLVIVLGIILLTVLL